MCAYRLLDVKFTTSNFSISFNFSDVEVVYENDVTPEEKEAALKLQLPPKFYSYRRAPPCPGCIGCEPDDEVSLSLREKPSLFETKNTLI